MLLAESLFSHVAKTKHGFRSSSLYVPQLLLSLQNINMLSISSFGGLSIRGKALHHIGIDFCPCTRNSYSIATSSGFLLNTTIDNSRTMSTLFLFFLFGLICLLFSASQEAPSEYDHFALITSFYFLVEYFSSRIESQLD